MISQQTATPKRADEQLERRARLAVQHIPLIRRLCERYRYSGVPMEDLVQIGSVGLLKAIDKFDPDRGSEFLAFAIPVVMGEIKNYFRDHGWAVKVPRKLQRHKQMVARAVEYLTHSHGRPPTVAELSEATGLSQEEVNETFELQHFGNLISLEAEFDSNGSGQSSKALDYLATEEAGLEAAAERIDLVKTMDSLNERERTIIRLKFYSGLSQTEIASRLGISQMHVSRLQRAALGKLREDLLDT